jgi:hypothetical protein
MYNTVLEYYLYSYCNSTIIPISMYTVPGTYTSVSTRLFSHF